MTRINVGILLSYVRLLSSVLGNICEIWWHGISTKSGDSYVHKLCSAYSGFIFILLWEGFMSDFLKSKRYDLIDMFNDTTRYFDEIFTIDNPEFEKNRTNTSERKILVKVINSDFNTSVHDKRDDFGFSIVNFPDVTWLPVFKFCCWLDLFGVLPEFWCSIKRIFKPLQNYWTRVTDIIGFEKHFENSLGHTLSFCPKGEISFREYVSEEISHPVSYGDLVYKLK